MILSGQPIAGSVTVDSAPDGAITATLIINGVDNATVLTVTNSGLNYKWDGTLPALSAGDFIQVRVTGTWSSVVSSQVILNTFADTKRVSGLHDLNTGAQMDLQNAPNSTAIQAFKTAFAELQVDITKWKGSTAPAMTGDAFARLGAPVGASISADIIALQAVADAITAKTASLPAAPAAVGSAMSLTPSERTSIANEVEAQIIDETDAEKVLTAITDKIASVNPSLGELTLSAIRSGLATSAEITAVVDVLTAIKGAGWSSTLNTLKSIYDAIPAESPTAIQNRQEMDANSIKLIDILADSNELQSNQGNWITATGYSTHNPADVKTAMEAAGSDLKLIKAKTDLTALDSTVAKELTLNTIISKIDVIDLIVDAITLKTMNLPANPAAVGSVMVLSPEERTAIANEVETQIIDETDAEKVLTAITNKIASVNPSLGELTLSAIRSGLATSTEITAVIDVLTAMKGADWSSTLNTLKAIYDAIPVAAPTAIQNRQEMDSNSTKLIDIKAKTDVTALDLTVAKEATINILTNKVDVVDTVVDGIATKTVNLPTSPAAVGSAMTLTEQTILDIQSGGSSTTPQQIWEYATRTLTSNGLTTGNLATLENINAIIALINLIQGDAWTDETLKSIKDSIPAAAPTAIQNRQEMDTNSTKLRDIVEDTNELQQNQFPDESIDFTTDPDQWKFVNKRKGTVTVISTKNIKQLDGSPVSATTQVIGEKTES